MKLDWTLVPWKGVEAVAQVMRDNVGKHGTHWTTVSREEHIKALARHVIAVMAGDTSENHLAHAATRALMALASDVVGAIVPSGPSTHAPKMIVMRDEPWRYDPSKGAWVHRKGFVKPDGSAWLASGAAGELTYHDTDAGLEAAMKFVEGS